jgi:hypothetical protein
MKKSLILGMLFLLFSNVVQLYGINACNLNGDINADGGSIINSTDIALAKDMVLGSAACTANIVGANACNATMLQKIVYAASPGGYCMPPNMTSANITLAWDPNSEPILAGYELYIGTASAVYAGPLVIANPDQTTYTIEGMPRGFRYFFALKAFGTGGEKSGFSNEVNVGLLAPEVSSGETLTVSSSIIGTRGTTASVPVTIAANLVNDAMPAAIQFTFVLPSWAKAAGATVTTGQKISEAGKTLACRWQAAGISTVNLKCIAYGDITTINAGVLAFINIPIPSTMSGTVNIGLNGALGAGITGESILTAVRAGKVTIQ